MDLGTVFMVYLIAFALYRNRRLALLASAFAAFSVLPIQLSHYFTVDTFTNFFGMLAFYVAVLLLPPADQPEELPEGDSQENEDRATDWLTREWGSVLPYVLFGAAFGLAMASKINAMLPGASAAWRGSHSFLQPAGGKPGALVWNLPAQPGDRGCSQPDRFSHLPAVCLFTGRVSLG